VIRDDPLFSLRQLAYTQCCGFRLDPDPGGQKLLPKIEKVKKISFFEVLDVLF
jgi:hypothetical protein